MEPLRFSDAPSDMFLQREAYRRIKVTENGKTSEIPLLQALYKAMSNAALKGNRLAQQYLLKLIAETEERYSKFRAERYIELRTLKRDGEKAIAEYKRRNLPSPNLLPHPDDIVLKPETGEAWVNGPEIPEDLKTHEFSLVLRDYFLLRSAHAEKIGRGPKLKHGDNTVCAYGVYAHIINCRLPRSLRWGPYGDASLMCDYQSLSQRERERRIQKESAHIEEMYSESRDPKLEARIDKILRMKKRGAGDGS